MDTRLAGIADRQGGAFTRAQALDYCTGDDELAYLVRAGELVRLRRGTYATRATLDGLDEVGLHLLRTHAVGLSLRGAAAFSHVSALPLYGVPLWNADLRTVHVTRLDTGAARNEAGVHHHVGDLTADELRWVDGLPVVPPARALVEMAGLNPFDAAVAAADAALHAGVTTREELDAALDRMRVWPRARPAARAVVFADRRADSVGESRLRVLMAEQGLPVPELQHHFYDEAGQLVGIVDFYFPDQRVVVEFDGRLKYAGDIADGSDAVYREKRREDKLRALGLVVVRVSWIDLTYPVHTANRIRHAFDVARTAPARLYIPR